MRKNLMNQIYIEQEKATSMRHGINYDANNNHYGEQQNHKQHNQHEQQRNQQPISNHYNVNLKYDPNRMLTGFLEMDTTIICV